MLISEYIKINTSLLLSDKIDERESQAIVRFLIEDSLQINRIDFSTYQLNKNEIDMLNKGIKRLKNNEPLQYITQKTYFYGLEFEVNSAVLIPRPETEELVHQVLKDFDIKKKQFIHKENQIFLEVGTGSGCISIALAKHLPYCHFVAIDISAKALEVAKKNAKKNDISNIEFIEMDFLNEKLYSNYSQLKNINYLISNPPYIRETEKVDMNKNVLDYEPHLALFVAENNPLIFYKALANFFITKMKTKNGLLYAEINQYLANETKALFESFGITNCIVFDDLQDNPRFIKATQRQMEKRE